MLQNEPRKRRRVTEKYMNRNYRQFIALLYVSNLLKCTINEHYNRYNHIQLWPDMFQSLIGLDSKACITLTNKLLSLLQLKLLLCFSVI
jgi:hypothetical protein